MMTHSKLNLALFILACTLIFTLSAPGTGWCLSLEEEQLQAFINDYVERMAPLEKEGNLAEWNAYTTGKKEYYDRMAEYTLKMALIHSDKKEYEALKSFRKSGKIKDPLLERQLSKLINEYGPNQIGKELLEKITRKEAEVQLAFNTHRGTVDGKEVTEKEIYEILAKEKDREKRRKAWEAQKSAGKKVAPLLIQLVKLRNEAARSLGFDNYYVMKIAFDDQKVEELKTIFEKLYATTEDAFSKNKGKADRILAERYNLKAGELMPWDYPNPFFQEAPGIFNASLDRYFTDKDIPALCSTFLKGAGMPIGDILSRSDLYEKQGKSPHAFCYDIDRGPDVRVLLNMRNNEESCSTMLHELGHAVYDKYIDTGLPWLLHDTAHIFTTEAIAQMFEKLTKNPQWLIRMEVVPKEEALSQAESLKDDLALQQLLFCRWTEVMFNFERELYRDPDQDLNTLWWDMVEKYQHLKRPEKRNVPDWASKIHFSSAPVYYHNYMLGELMSSQLMHTLGVKVLKDEAHWKEIDFVNRPEPGKWLRENIFKPGARYRWDELLIKATGENLNPEYFSQQFVR